MTSLRAGAAVAATAVSVSLSAPAAAYPVDCAILLCLAGGWPASAECANARAVFIARITPWPVEPPLQILVSAHWTAHASGYLARADPAHVRRIEAEAGSEARRVRERGELPGRLQVARRTAYPKRAERVRGVAFRPFALVTFIWARK